MKSSRLSLASFNLCDVPATAYGVVVRLVNLTLPLLLFLGIVTGAQAEPIRILALGDSLTAGYGLSKADSFTVRLEKALREKGHAVTVINAGVSGDTTAGGLNRVDWLLSEPLSAVIISLGANDGLRGLDPAAMRKNLDEILNRVSERGLPVLLAGMRAPPNLGPEYGQEFNAVFPALAREHDAVFFPFFLEGVAAVPTLNQADGIHPNPAGVSVIVDNILPHVLQLIDRIE